MPQGALGAVIGDRDGSVWITSEQGLTRFRAGRFETLGTLPGLPRSRLTTLCEDREGGLWVGTATSGLVRLADRTMGAVAPETELARASITTVGEDGEGRLIIGTRAGAVFVHERGGRTWRVGHPDGSSSRGTVYSILAAPGRGVLVGSEAGLAVLVGESLVPAKDWPHGRSVRALTFGRDGDVWVAERDGGIHRFRDGRVVQGFGHDDGLPKGLVTAILVPKDGGILAGGRGGLARLRGERFAPLQRSDGEQTPLSVLSLHEDTKGRVWVGTLDSGIAMVAGDRIEVLGTAGGAFHPRIAQILHDEGGFLWLGFSAGLQSSQVAPI